MSKWPKPLIFQGEASWRWIAATPITTSSPTREGVFFVTRLKTNADWARVESLEVPKGGKILRDEIIRLQRFVAGRPDLDDLRRVVVWLVVWNDPKSYDFVTYRMKSEGGG
ncbi:hypothetical protein [Pedosphaera parvula]|uniref:Uncharacterized protein n=1 Tax=Pedosphaera parvula (strain Ellin514) TaxID=320771 RepID=B9XA95_PEDPL|nr:hypothetical protein [Pedosphaera parvula]EEF63436.1 hypothetical protein Cflav_PD6071 [Pedosphaera parvula Ellin514]